MLAGKDGWPQILINVIIIFPACITYVEAYQLLFLPKTQKTLREHNMLCCRHLRRRQWRRRVNLASCSALTATRWFWEKRRMDAKSHRPTATDHQSDAATKPFLLQCEASPAPDRRWLGDKRAMNRRPFLTTKKAYRFLTLLTNMLPDSDTALALQEISFLTSSKGCFTVSVNYEPHSIFGQGWWFLISF